MARLLGHQHLDLTKPLYAKKPITLDGVSYLPGDVVDVSKLQARLIRVLHDQRKIGHETYAMAPRGAEPPPPKSRPMANPPKPLGDAPGVISEVHSKPKKTARGLA